MWLRIVVAATPRRVEMTFAARPSASNPRTSVCRSIDFEHLFRSRTPFVFAFVFARPSPFLLLAFRSIVIGLKAIVLNSLSVAGAYGILAAIVMVLVFSVFITQSFDFLKQFGVGLAAAVLIDATIIRGVLLPASVKLLGERNWHLPNCLEWLPRVAVASEADPTPEAPALLAGFR